MNLHSVDFVVVHSIILVLHIWLNCYEPGRDYSEVLEVFLQCLISNVFWSGPGPESLSEMMGAKPMTTDTQLPTLSTESVPEL